MLVVRLVQEDADQPQQAGFLIYMPVYRNNAPLTTVNERRAALIGYLNAFGMITASSAIAIPLILLARTRKRAT